MKAVLEHNTIWFLRSLSILVCFFFFQSSIITVSANTVDSEFDPYNPIFETLVQDEIEGSSWVEFGLRRVLSKVELGSECEDLLSIERDAAKGSTQGGLNLFKFGSSQATKGSWKVGDRFLRLPNRGTPKLN